VTADGLTIVFTSSRPGGVGGRDLFLAERASPDEPFGAPFPLGAPVNSPGWEHNAHISPDGLQLYFASDGALYSASRTTRQARFTSRVHLGACVNPPGAFTTGPSATSDGLELLYFSDAPGGKGGFDLWLARRASIEEAFCDVENLAALNTAADELHCAIAANGLAIIFDSLSRSPAKGSNDIWIATRPTRDEPFSPPVSIDAFGFGSAVNSSQVEYTASLSPGWPEPGAKLYFSRAMPDYSLAQLYEATWLTDPPEAVIALDPSPALVHQEITLDGSGSFSRGPHAVEAYAWDLGDGESLQGAVVRHAYGAPGRYLVTLTVVDGRGRADSSTTKVDVICGALELEPWTAADIGTPAYPGSTTLERDADGACLLLCAGGRDFSRAANEGHQVLTAVRGDVGLAASIELLGGRSGAKVGLCLRESPGADGASVALLVEKGATLPSRVLLQVRDASGFRQEVVGSDVALADQPWLRLERRGGEVIGSIGADGSSWTEVARAAVDFPDAAFLGFAGTGRDLSPAVAFTPLTARFCAIDPAVEPPAARFRRGDPNASGLIDLSDAVTIFSHLFLGAADPTCPDAADANDSGVVDISDGIFLLGSLFLGTAPPAPPGPAACGPDPTGDALPECSYPPAKCES
jgi:chitodextrinase